MEVWRVEQVERPQVMSPRNCLVALVAHLIVLLLFLLISWLTYRKPEKIEVIDLTVIVNENLDGKEDEPPPLRNPTPPEPPKPKPKPAPKKVEPPKALEQMVTNIVVKKEAEKKKPEEPPPKKKTAAELREERLRKIRESMTLVKKTVKIEVKNAPSADGRTAKQQMSQEEIRKLLGQGYRPGTQNQIATSIKQRCLSLIQRAINEKWDQLSPQIGKEGTVLLSVQFNSSGGMVNVRLSGSSGDRMSDEAALSVARQVTHIAGLDPAFISEYRSSPLTLQYNVRSR